PTGLSGVNHFCFVPGLSHRLHKKTRRRSFSKSTVGTQHSDLAAFYFENFSSPEMEIAELLWFSDINDFQSAFCGEGTQVRNVRHVFVKSVYEIKILKQCIAEEFVQ